MGIAAGPAWDGARNLADLGGVALVGGGMTRRGRVYRSAAPEWMTDQGWGDLREAGVTTVVDLRNELERGRTAAHPAVGAVATAGITFVHAPTEDPTDPDFLQQCGPWLDHPRSWSANLRSYPRKIAHVLDTVARATSSVLIHCAGGRDRTGMISALLLVLAGATPASVVASYEAGFRGASAHRGHGWSHDPALGGWVLAPDRSWTADELDAALDDRRPTLLEWVDTFDVEAYLRAAGVDEGVLKRLRDLLVG